MLREGSIKRNTRETNIYLKIILEGTGNFIGSSGVGFFDHLLELFSKHSGCDLFLEASGDTHVDYHHLVEDIGIVFGKALKEALGDKKGINRYGTMYIPMDEALVRTVIDFSGRPYLVFNVNGLKDKVGDFDTELVEEFLRAFVNNSGMTLHIEKLAGRNTHHVIEAVFKALARCLKIAWTIDKANNSEIPSSKGMLE
jgi:imidazoleglycerol-phosphate dehydratase